MQSPQETGTSDGDETASMCRPKPVERFAAAPAVWPVDLEPVFRELFPVTVQGSRQRIKEEQPRHRRAPFDIFRRFIGEVREEQLVPAVVPSEHTIVRCLGRLPSLPNVRDPLCEVQHIRAFSFVQTVCDHTAFL